jgi:aarF domain-containing kinase
VLGGVIAFGDEIRSSYDAAERAGRVGSALVVCINDYRKTLNKREKIDDDAEKKRLLEECHKRCAERTLKVLEKNGGIFIKLGQHLVCNSMASVPCEDHILTKPPTERYELPPPI